MNERSSPSTGSGNHESVWTLLPWYVNGTLDARESALVELHLAGCPRCLEETVRCRDVAGVARATRPAERDAWAPSPEHFAAIVARLGAPAGVSASRGRARPALFERIRRALSTTPSPVRWALAAQGALVVALATALTLSLQSTPPAQLYETLSSQAARPASDRARLRIAFAEDIAERQLRALVAGIGASIVEGPSAQGLYTVELPFAASDRAQTDDALGRLNAEPAVRMATRDVSGGGR